MKVGVRRVAYVDFHSKRYIRNLELNLIWNLVKVKEYHIIFTPTILE